MQIKLLVSIWNATQDWNGLIFAQIFERKKYYKFKTIGLTHDRSKFLFDGNSGLIYITVKKKIKKWVVKKEFWQTVQAFNRVLYSTLHQLDENVKDISVCQLNKLSSIS